MLRIIVVLDVPKTLSSRGAIKQMRRGTLVFIDKFHPRGGWWQSEPAMAESQAPNCAVGAGVHIPTAKRFFLRALLGTDDSGHNV
jgi:hypothetical protein